MKRFAWIAALLFGLVVSMSGRPAARPGDAAARTNRTTSPRRDDIRASYQTNGTSRFVRAM